ncbi:MAG TPA: hypothetical protein VIA06_12765 [Candidatus Dormibacteraeota bacterium]|jgi:hypothetical protein|nr:hypothetical protein [Candidatus Dormibacteraeota bacterium]
MYEYLHEAEQLTERLGEMVGRPDLLRDEDPSSRQPDVAAHWADVYRSLLEREEAFLNRRPGRRGTETLELEVQRLRLHLNFWEARLRAL